MVSMPRTIFDGIFNSAVGQLIRPPTKSMLGVLLRRSPAIPTVKEVLEASLQPS